MECIVEHEYVAEEEDELNLKKGDKITDVVQVLDGWWEGCLNGRRGLFPDNFVKVLNRETKNSNEAPKLREGASKSGRKVRAIFSYVPTQEDELRLEVGDVIDYLSEVEEGWWRGVLHGETGIFPSNFVAEIEKNVSIVSSNGQKNPHPTPITSVRTTDDSPPKLPPKPVREMARCFYPYFSQNDDELSLEEGDIVSIISKESEDEGWWRGECRGRIGVFPDNFVEIISSDSSSSSTIPSSSPYTIGLKASERSPTHVKESPNVSPTTAKEGVSPQVTKEGVGPHGTHYSRESVVGRNSVSNANSSTSVPTTNVSSISSSIKDGVRLSTSKDGAKPKAVSPILAVSPLQQQTSVVPSIDEINLNSVERGSEKLSHLTISRAKAPKRRPPSTLIPDIVVIENGKAHSKSKEELLPSPLEKKEVEEIDGNKNSINSNTVNKPKVAIPWMAELKQKQDKKGGLTSPTSVSPQGQIGGGATISKPPPPLPAKPHLGQEGLKKNEKSIEKSEKFTIHNEKNEKFGEKKGRGDEVERHEGEKWVRVEEYNRLKERVEKLEEELEGLRALFMKSQQIL